MDLMDHKFVVALDAVFVPVVVPVGIVPVPASVVRSVHVDRQVEGEVAMELETAV